MVDNDFESEKKYAAAVALLMRRFEPRISKAFINALNQIKNSVPLEKITELLQTARYGEIIQLFDQDLTRAAFGEFTTALTNTYIEAGTANAAMVPPITVTPKVPILGEIPTAMEVSVHFDVLNPAMIQSMQEYKLNLVQGLTSEVREAIRAEIFRALDKGMNPLDTARMLRGMIGLTEHQRNIIATYRSQLESIGTDKQAVGTGPLKRLLRDKRSDNKIVRAIKNNEKLDAEYINNLVERYQNRFIQYRAQTIARTESISLINKSNLQLWHNMVDEGIVSENEIVRKWIYTHDSKTRHAHRTIPSLNPDGVGLKEPFKSELGLILYPGDPNVIAKNRVNCRCTIFMRLKY